MASADIEPASLVFFLDSILAVWRAGGCQRNKGREPENAAVASGYPVPPDDRLQRHPPVRRLCGFHFWGGGHHLVRGTGRLVAVLHGAASHGAGSPGASTAGVPAHLCAFGAWAVGSRMGAAVRQ